MKNIRFWLIGALAFVVAVAFGISAQTKASDNNRWEYLTLYGAPAQLAGHNAQGQVGWELVAVSCQENNNQCAFFFKRRK